MSGIDFTVFKGSPSGIVETKSYRALPTGTQVLVKVTHSGICWTDEVFKHADMVLGHEGVGVVQQLGEAVQGFKVGDVVGWGYVHKTCGTCTCCLAGHDNYCAVRTIYGYANKDQGSFGTHAIWDASWLFKIPKEIAPEHAAPLMCAGATVFAIIDSYNIRPTDRVGVVGIGGLGHLAIQFLAKIGGRVVVFSNTEAKREEAMKLGAAEFYPTTGVQKLDIGVTLDHLIITANLVPDQWMLYMSVMSNMGSVYPLTVSSEPLKIPAMPLNARGIKFQGSVGASRGVQKKMLQFAAAHNIKPTIEQFPMTKAGVEEGMAKLREGRMRYRAVLVA
ncbi:putative NADP-dependent alcohol dehydrogenase C 2 [Roridomyces roridus]|uniref:NADP-dependent alcohol dehydrogenase C 2 n=1 Tax=Roridomyces roridus TaxID=1738132 RepID=A0AAD7BRS2_9AGAR|nr:putative NADP-dependent alcohol dehydrogenase C 2 [Roridomyces roridus]